MRNRVEGKDGGGVAAQRTAQRIAQRTAQRTGSTETPGDAQGKDGGGIGDGQDKT